LSKRLFVRRLIAVTAVLAVASFGAACGTDTPEGTAAKDIKQLPEDFITGSYLGLTVGREDLSQSLSSQTGNSYVSETGLFSLRDGELLQATLQVNKLSSAARSDDPEFQQQVANQIGGTKVQAFVMGDRSVYRTSQRKQSITSWFEGDYFLILAVRETYPTPRALLRELLTKVEI
jgi:hypothetical protein